MNSGDKLKAMFWVWVAFVAACMFTFGGDVSQAEDVFIALFFVLGALFATRLVMHTPLPEEVVTTRKAKTHKVDRMLSRLSDEEMEQLRQRLSADDGELVSLDEVMRGGKES
jgi:hypothetical protein